MLRQGQDSEKSKIKIDLAENLIALTIISGNNLALYEIICEII